MSAKLSPYLNFNGTAREAMTFYQSVLGGQLDVSTFGEFGMDGEAADQIMHSQLATGDMLLMGSDMPPGMPGEPKGGTVAIFGDDAETLRGYFTNLSEGGTVTVPLDKQPWGDEFGAVTDRYGVDWMINISQQSA